MAKSGLAMNAPHGAFSSNDLQPLAVEWRNNDENKQNDSQRL
jgi:hypothetical protein